MANLFRSVLSRFLARFTKVPAHLNALLAKLKLPSLFAAPPKWAAFPAEAHVARKNPGLLCLYRPFRPSAGEVRLMNAEATHPASS